MKEDGDRTFTGFTGEPQISPAEQEGIVDIEDVPEEVIEFWGPGYEPEMYLKLNDRYKYWENNLPEGVVLDVGTQALLRQICGCELEINKIRAEGGSTEKQTNSLNTLLGSALLRPSQQKDDADTTLNNTPLWKLMILLLHIVSSYH